MILLTILLGLVALGLIIGAIYRLVFADGGGILFLAGLLVGFIWFIVFCFILNWQISSNYLTGYVYSKDTFGGVTTYHLRFSENAGSDSQPSFCVNAGAPSQAALDAVVGTDKKVVVYVPATGIYFSNDLIHCASDAQLKSVDGVAR